MTWVDVTYEGGPLDGRTTRMLLDDSSRPTGDLEVPDSLADEPALDPANQPDPILGYLLVTDGERLIMKYAPDHPRQEP